MLALVRDYTFYAEKVKERKWKTYNKVSWRCTSGGTCRARFVVNEQKQIIRSKLDHTHDPPSFTIVNGVYFRT